MGDPAQETPRAFGHGMVQQPAGWPLPDDNPIAKTIRSATGRANSTSWVTMIIVIPASAKTRATPSTSRLGRGRNRSEEHTPELHSHLNLLSRLLLEKKKQHP